MNAKSTNHEKSCEVRPWLIGVSILCIGCESWGECFPLADSHSQNQCKSGEGEEDGLKKREEDAPHQK